MTALYPRLPLWCNKVSNQALLDASLNGLDKVRCISNQPHPLHVPGLVAGGWAEAVHSSRRGDAVAIAGGGPVVATFIRDLLIRHQVSGAEPAGAAVEGALQLAPKETVDGGTALRIELERETSGYDLEGISPCLAAARHPNWDLETLDGMLRFASLLRSNTALMRITGPKAVVKGPMKLLTAVMSMRMALCQGSCGL